MLAAGDVYVVCHTATTVSSSSLIQSGSLLPCVQFHRVYVYTAKRFIAARTYTTYGQDKAIIVVSQRWCCPWSRRILFDGRLDISLLQIPVGDPLCRDAIVLERIEIVPDLDSVRIFKVEATIGNSSCRTSLNVV